MIRFATDPTRRVRITTFLGTVDDDELLSAFQSLLDDPTFDPGFDDVVDLQAVERLEVSAVAMRALMALFAGVDELGYVTRLAIIAPNDLGYGLGRMYEMMRTGAPEEVSVFRGVDEAFAWLDDPMRVHSAPGARSAA